MQWKIGFEGLQRILIDSFNFPQKPHPSSLEDLKVFTATQSIMIHELVAGHSFPLLIIKPQKVY